MTASNTWGLFVLVILLGYGLVDIPRSAWHRSHTNYSLNYSYFKVAKLRVDLEEAKSTLSEVCGEVKYLLQKIRYNDPFYKYVNVIVKKVSGTCDVLCVDYSDFLLSICYSFQVVLYLSQTAVLMILRTLRRELPKTLSQCPN